MTRLLTVSTAMYMVFVLLGEGVLIFDGFSLMVPVENIFYKTAFTSCLVLATLMPKFLLAVTAIRDYKKDGTGGVLCSLAFAGVMFLYYNLAGMFLAPQPAALIRFLLLSEAAVALGLGAGILDMGVLLSGAKEKVVAAFSRKKGRKESSFNGAGEYSRFN